MGEGCNGAGHRKAGERWASTTRSMDYELKRFEGRRSKVMMRIGTRGCHVDLVVAAVMDATLTGMRKARNDRLELLPVPDK